MRLCNVLVSLCVLILIVQQGLSDTETDKIDKLEVNAPFSTFPAVTGPPNFFVGGTVSGKREETRMGA